MEDSPYYTSDLKEKRERKEKLQQEIEDLETEIEEIENRLITEDNTAVEETLQTDKDVKKGELEEKKKTLEEKKEELHNLNDKYESYEEVAEILDEEIAAEKGKLENILEHGRLSHIQELDEEIAAEKGKLENILEDGQSRLSQIREQQEQVNKELQKIEEKREEINELASNVEKIQQTAEGLLERTTSGALGEQFEDRQKELQKDLQFWLRASFVSIAVLIISSLIIYADIALSPESAVISISKLALLLPISVMVWFSVSNYSRTRKLMEEYEFKARIGLSLNGFREVLHAEIPDEQSDEVAQFVMETMDKIYSNPQQNVGAGQSQEEQDPLPTGQKPLVEFVRRLGNE